MFKIPTSYVCLSNPEFRAYRRKLLLKHKYYKDFYLIFLSCPWCGKGERLVFEIRKGSRVKFACAFKCGFKTTVDRKELSKDEKWEMNKARAILHGSWKRKKKRKKPPKAANPPVQYLIDV